MTQQVNPEVHRLQTENERLRAELAETRKQLAEQHRRTLGSPGLASFASGLEFREPPAVL